MLSRSGADDSLILFAYKMRHPDREKMFFEALAEEFDVRVDLAATGRLAEGYARACAVAKGAEEAVEEVAVVGGGMALVLVAVPGAEGGPEAAGATTGRVGTRTHRTTTEATGTMAAGTTGTTETMGTCPDFCGA